MERINVLGQPCPIPVIETKKALAKPEAEGAIVLVDNMIAVQNLEKMAKGLGYTATFSKQDEDRFEVTIRLDGENTFMADRSGEASGLQKKDRPDMEGKGGLIVVIGQNVMGNGAEELGKILIKGFIYSLTELETPPTHVIFLNSGAHLTAEGSNTVSDLKKLEEKGTKILTCGTCSNYYGLQDKLAVGSITNMFGITETMAAAGRVVNI